MKCKYDIQEPYSHLKEDILKLPDTFASTGQVVYNGRNQVRYIQFSDGKKYAVKRFKKPLIYQRADYTFIRQSKAKRAYLYGIRFLQLGISTPMPVAYTEVYQKGLFSTGYFISEICTDPDMRLIREGEGSNGLLEALVHFIMKMHKKGILHGDLNLSNFLYHEDPNSQHEFQITTIDINRTTFVNHCTEKQCLTNLVKITHVRPVLQRIVELYAEIRGWDIEKSVTFVMNHLDKFERRRAFRHKLTGRE